MWIYRMDTSIYRGDSIYTFPHLTISSCNRGVFMWNRYQHWSEGPKMFNWNSWKKLWRQNLISSPFHLCGSFISYSSTLYLSCTRAHVHTRCVKWLFHLENCQNIPREHISLFLSSVSSSRGCVGVCQKCAGIDKTHGAKQLCFIQSLSLFSLPSPSHSLFPSLLALHRLWIPCIWEIRPDWLTGLCEPAPLRLPKHAGAKLSHHAQSQTHAAAAAAACPGSAPPPRRRSK